MTRLLPLLALGCLLLAAGCGENDEVEPDPTLEPFTKTGAGDFQWVTPEDVRAYQVAGNDLLLVDTRPTSAYEKERIEGAVAVPPERIEAVDSLPSEPWVVLYCSCPDDAMAMAVFRHAFDGGRQNMAILEGGFPAWEEAGYPTVSGPEG
ncbi:MAG: rhodanese-like domain-containing protein [Gemmatimonadota bacterium]|nr:rhodanese-like domain-containing protein [Gemmatimonadota bacterium]